MFADSYVFPDLCGKDSIMEKRFTHESRTYGC